jgi:hypothetical protein
MYYSVSVVSLHFGKFVRSFLFHCLLSVNEWKFYYVYKYL